MIGTRFDYQQIITFSSQLLGSKQKRLISQAGLLGLKYGGTGVFSLLPRKIQPSGGWPYPISCLLHRRRDLEPSTVSSISDIYTCLKIFDTCEDKSRASGTYLRMGRFEVKALTHREMFAGSVNRRSEKGKEQSYLTIQYSTHPQATEPRFASYSHRPEGRESV